MMQFADSLTTTLAAAAERFDSLPAVPAADLPCAVPADSLFRVAAELSAEPFDPVLTAEQTFGSASELVAGGVAGTPFAEALTDHPVFQGIVLLLAVAYMLMICAHFYDIADIFPHRRNNYAREGAGTLVNERFVQTAAVIGLLMAAVLVVRFAEGTPGAVYGTMGLLLSALAAVFGITLFQFGALYLIGRITLSSDLTRAIIYFKVLYFGMMAIAVIPSALLLIFCPPGEGRLWSWVVMVLSGTVVILFLKESLLLFLSKKISILHWFLYLCTVECFPVSLVWLLATRC